MKSSSLYLDVATRSSELRVWLVKNIRSITGVLALLAMEAVTLFAINPPPEYAAAIGAVFCFLSLGALGYTVSIGSELGQNHEDTLSRHSRTAEHVGYATAVGIFLLMGVVAIEVAIRLVGGLWGPTWLMWTHFGFVILSVATYVTVRVFLTGKVDPVRHKKWAYVFTALYFSTLFTGTTLLLQKFPIS